MPCLRPLLLTLVLLASVPALGAVAVAQQTIAPPGNSAIDEYMETVPGAGGDTRPQSPAGTPDAGGALDAAQRAELRAQGPDGAALARVVDATAPDAAAVPAPAAARGATGTNESPVTAVLAAATGRDEGSALGPLLPAILLVSLLGVLALVLARRRGSA